MVFVRWICMCLVALTLPATILSEVRAQGMVEKRAEKLLANWQAWAAKNGVTRGAIAASFNGELVIEQGIGMSASDPAPIASISKSITGLCALKLVEAGKLSLDAPVKKFVPSLDTDVTLSALLTHASGFAKDVTQRPDRYPGRDQEYLEWVSEREIKKTRGKLQPGEFRYNNANYAMVGAAIAAVSGDTYEATCKRYLFDPAGIMAAKLNPEWRIMSSWGGWYLSAKDHLALVNAYFKADGLIGKTPDQLPNFDFQNGLKYGLGYMFRKGRNGGYNYWHDGKWDAVMDNKHHKFGAYFVRYDNGWAISVNHDISALKDEHFQLDQIFIEATHLPL